MKKMLMVILSGLVLAGCAATEQFTSKVTSVTNKAQSVANTAADVQRTVNQVKSIK